MAIHIHRHARQRMVERGASESEVLATVESGEQFPARFGRVGFRRNFAFSGEWKGCRYATRQIEAYAVREEGWHVVTVLVKFFG